LPLLIDAQAIQSLRNGRLISTSLEQLSQPLPSRLENFAELAPFEADFP
jgi:hypothetical protein